jgi:hypothetical protein
MKLEFLKGNSCPHCGCKVVSFEGREIDRFARQGEFKYRQHCNGGYHEYRQFACGCRLEYSPNFSRTLESDSYSCGNNPEYLAKQARKEEFKKALKNFIEDYKNIDEDLKRYALGRINF